MQNLLREIDQISRIHSTAADFEKSLALLSALKSGAVSLDQVTLVNGGWHLNPPRASGTQAVPIDIVIEEGDAEPAAAQV